MVKNLVIVESPAKAKTIEGFLGKEFLVKSSFGHIRDLKKGNKGVLIEEQFEPVYEVSADKKTVVSELKKLADEAQVVWLASDEDREGEAISWHLKEVLKLKEEKIKRIVFHEITKPAILRAIEQPRGIDYNLVNAQQARRVLDRLVGFEISPVLWRKVKPSLSAGRVQSVSVRLVVDREREVQAFNATPAFRVNAIFTLASGKSKQQIKSELPERFQTEAEAEVFLKQLIGKNFTVDSVEKRPLKKSPAPPFTTSTLQQEASRKLRFSVTKTMRMAQQLYEAGYITYMRTDSVNLSQTAQEGARNEIISAYGQEFHKQRQFKTKSASAQEAHEAIRPTYFENHSIEGEKDLISLYELIWKRAIASQMSEAEIEKTVLKIRPDGLNQFFQAEGEIIQFEGFLKVYLESDDDESGDEETSNNLPAVTKGDLLEARSITATQRYSRPPSRYTEASLVKKLEELGIGRPSTYAPTISTIQKRGYVERTEIEGFQRNFVVLELAKDAISRQEKTETTGADKGKLAPTDIGMLVNDFLMVHFPKVMDFQFTANVEEEFDHIAEGNLDWKQMIETFYKPFHANVEDTIENSERITGERILGADPTTGWQVSVRMGRFGPIAVKTNLEDAEAKPLYANLRQGMHIEQLTFEDAMELFKLPREVGMYEDKEMVIGVGRFGPYVRHDGKFVSLKKEQDPLAITAEEAIELIQEKRAKDANRMIHDFEAEGVQVLNGMYGPYITQNKKNYKIPKGTDAQGLTIEACLEIIANTPESTKKSPRAKKRG
ncbi:MAG: type I DNA topoisomerase [Sphingobacteriaceae bacterium]|nr:type I DNA topoisomerase [Sphingobacteriaceae bacterium]